VSHCTPTASGTTSLTVALEACGVGAGDEVIVPGLSWVASASAVAGINAVPVLTDVDAATYCLSPDAVAAAMTTRTAAITAVHLYSAVADLDALRAVADAHDVPLIEDCAQAHGARHHDRPVGSIGDVGAFSMQTSKLLTSGEGGAVVTDDPELARRAEHLRADGRTVDAGVAAGAMELVETGEISGSNACLSEIHAAVLLAQLEELDEQLARRRANADRLGAALRSLGSVIQETSPGTTARVHYRYAFQPPDEALTRVPLARLAEALTALLGFTVVPTHRPLDDNPLHRPATRRRYDLSPAHRRALDPGRFELPEAHRIHRRTLTFAHEILLARPDQIDRIPEALATVLGRLDELAAVDR
jgi:dTDP-4-amino-4,6-dideoxygalactose transaminase